MYCSHFPSQNRIGFDANHFLSVNYFDTTSWITERRHFTMNQRTSKIAIRNYFQVTLLRNTRDTRKLEACSQLPEQLSRTANYCADVNYINPHRKWEPLIYLRSVVVHCSVHFISKIATILLKLSTVGIYKTQCWEISTEHLKNNVMFSNSRIIV